MLDFLRKSDVIRKLGLTVEKLRAAEAHREDPDTRRAGRRRGVRRNRPALRWRIFDPSTVTAYVPPRQDPPGEDSPTDPGRAERWPRSRAIEKTPYIELTSAIDQRREVRTKVKVTLAPAERPGPNGWIPAAYGFCLSAEPAGRVPGRPGEGHRQTKLTGVMVRATEEAYQAYHRRRDYQLVLYIQDKTQIPADQGPIEQAIRLRVPRGVRAKRRDRSEPDSPGGPVHARADPLRRGPSPELYPRASAATSFEAAPVVAPCPLRLHLLGRTADRRQGSLSPATS